MITSMFYELSRQRDESTHQWQFWLHENYKCNIVCYDNEWAREAILCLLNWFLGITKEDAVWFCKWMDCKLIVNTKLTNVHGQSSSIFIFLWFLLVPHIPTLLKKCAFYACQNLGNKMVWRRVSKYWSKVKSSSCFRGSLLLSFCL